MAWRNANELEHNSNSIKRMIFRYQLSKDNMGFKKKRIIKFGEERDKLQRSLGGISEMKKVQI